MPWQDIPGLSSAGFVADPPSLRRSTGRQINWNAIPDLARLGALFTTLSATAAAGATALATTPLPVDVPIGTNLYFGLTGELARTTAPAAKGDMALTVEALDVAVHAGDKALLPAQTSGTSGLITLSHKAVAAGKIMSQLADGSIVPREFTNTPASHIMLEGHVENSRVASLSGVGTIVGGVLYTNLLPDFQNPNFAAWIAELSASGCTFQFETYEDGRKIWGTPGFG